MDISAKFYFGWILYNIIAFVFFILLLSGHGIKREQNTMFLSFNIILFIILSVFGNCITPDYESYREIVETIATTKDPFVHVEKFYIWWISYIGNNFFLYLLLLYLVSYSFIYYSFRLLHISNIILFLFVYVVFILYYSMSGRQFLFNAVFFTGMILLAKRHWLSSLIIIFTSVFLHKIAYIAIPLLLICFLSLNRRLITIILCLFPIVAIIGNYFVDYYLNDIFLEINWLAGSNYLVKDSTVGGSLWWSVISFYHTSVNYLCSFYVLYYMRNIRSSVRKVDRIMYSMLFWCVYISLLFYAFNLPDKTIASRVSSLSLLPLCYLFSQLPGFIYLKKEYKIIFFFVCLFYMLFNDVYIVGISHSLLH